MENSITHVNEIYLYSKIFFKSREILNTLTVIVIKQIFKMTEEQPESLLERKLE